MKNIKWNSIIYAICYVAAGVYFYMNPGLSQADLCTIIGGALIVFGVISLLSYLFSKVETSFSRNDFASGLIMITLGIIAIVYQPLFINLVYIIIGVIVMISGYIKLQDCVDTWRFGSSHGTLYLVLSLISLTFGLLILVNPFKDSSVLHTLIAVGLIYSGISDLFSSIYLSTKMMQFVKEKEEANNPKQEEPQKEKETEEVEEKSIVEEPKKQIFINDTVKIKREDIKEEVKEKEDE